MWVLIRRSGTVNRAQSIGAAIAITAAIGMLAAAASWMIAGLTDSRLEASAGLLVTLASSFIGIAAIIAGMTVASTIATGLRERRGQFALLAAVGATAERLRTMILLETLLLFVVSAPPGALLGAGLAAGTVPLLQGIGFVPTNYALPFSVLPALCATTVMLAVALIASRSASRSALQAPAAEAMHAAALESATLGAGRRWTAWGLLLGGLLMAAAPLLLPGMLGVALATMATLLMIAAIAVSGPALAGGIAKLLLSRAPNVLAFMNVRGFSRRLTAVLVPFALVAALGAVQLSTNAIVDLAAREQLRTGTNAELMGSATSAEQVEAIRSLPAVHQVAVLGSVSGGVSLDQENDLPFTIWEPATFGTLTTTGTVNGILDPDVTAGSLDDLGRPDAIAVSQDALLGSFTGVGDPLTIRLGDQRENRTIVAVYAASLGFGDYLIADPTDEPVAGAVLVATEEGASETVQDAASATGLKLEPPATFIDREPANGETTMSSVLLFALLTFALLAAINTLVAMIRGRRDEFALLGRIGATRATLMRTVLIETMLAAGLAVLLGTAAAVPSAVGAAVALLGAWPSLPAAGLTVIPAVLLACAAVAATATSAAAARPRVSATASA